jgi:hypothetical protein
VPVMTAFEPMAEIVIKKYMRTCIVVLLFEATDGHSKELK